MASLRAVRAFCSSAWESSFCSSARAELSGLVAYAPMKTESGHFVTSLGVVLPTGHTDWYFLDFPHAAMVHQLQKGDKVRVTGPLNLITVRHPDENDLYTIVKMEVADMKRSSSLEPSEKKAEPTLPVTRAEVLELESDLKVASTVVPRGNSASTKRESMLKLWDDFFSDPSGWMDLRKIKKSEKPPDFKRFSGNEAIWIESFLLLPQDREAIKGRLRQIGKL